MKALRTFCALFRVGEWFDSKVPMLLLPAMYSLILSAQNKPFSFSGEVIRLMILALFFCAFLAFGYVINDYSDLETDRLAGKQKVMQSLSKTQALWLVIAVGLVGWVLILAADHSPITFIALLIIYFFGASYSAPPLRFKERGVWGLIVSSTAQRCFPLMLICIILRQRPDPYFILCVISGGIVGLRYILVHQYIDAENDRRSNTETFSLKHLALAKDLIYLTFAAELILLLVLLIPVFRRFPLTILFILCYSAVQLIRSCGCRAVYGHTGLLSFDQTPLEDLYNQYLPILFAALLCSVDIRWLPIALVLAAILLPPAVKRLKFPVKIISDRLNAHKSNTNGRKK